MFWLKIVILLIIILVIGQWVVDICCNDDYIWNNYRQYDTDLPDEKDAE